MLYLTDTDNQLIKSGSDSLRNMYSHLMADIPKKSFSLVCAAYLASMTPPSNDLKLLLCKLRHDHVDPLNYVISKNPDQIIALPGIRRLVEKYSINPAIIMFGKWSRAYRAHELVIYSLAINRIRGFPFVISKNALYGLVNVYNEQEKSAKAGAVLQKKATEVEDLLMMDPLARKERAAEGRGACYQCNAVKPKEITCAVCGYTPQRLRG